MRELRETELRENFVRVYGRDKETEKREGGLSPISALARFELARIDKEREETHFFLEWRPALEGSAGGAAGFDCLCWIGSKAGFCLVACQ